MTLDGHWPSRATEEHPAGCSSHVGQIGVGDQVPLELAQRHRPVRRRAPVRTGLAHPLRQAVLLILLRLLAHIGCERMSWQMDGRNGTARLGDSRREGFALMRDQARHLIAFHSLCDQAYGPAGPERSPLDQFVISEGDFEPDAA